MNPLPLPVRVAAGLLASAVEQARHLPEHLSELPVSAASRAIQAGMRMQQRVTALAVKGDEVLSLFHAVEETPSWARFDEDEDPPDRPGRGGGGGLAPVVPGPGARRGGEADEATVARALAPEQEADRGSVVDEIAQPGTVRGESAVDGIADQGGPARDTGDTSARNGGAGNATDAEPPAPAAAGSAPRALPDYDQLTLPQLRGKLRALSLAQLEELLEHEHANRERAPFVTMLSNRIVTVRSR